MKKIFSGIPTIAFNGSQSRYLKPAPKFHWFQQKGINEKVHWRCKSCNNSRFLALGVWWFVESGVSNFAWLGFFVFARFGEEVTAKEECLVRFWVLVNCLSWEMRQFQVEISAIGFVYFVTFLQRRIHWAIHVCCSCNESLRWVRLRVARLTKWTSFFKSLSRDLNPGLSSPH